MDLKNYIDTTKVHKGTYKIPWKKVEDDLVEEMRHQFGHTHMRYKEIKGLASERVRKARRRWHNHGELLI
jgi:hypothetical protein